MPLPKTLRWYEGRVPNLEIGQKIFYIQWHDNCPAAMTKRWRETTIRALQATILPNRKGKPEVICTGVEIDDIVHRDNCLRPYEIYYTQEEVERDSRWYPVDLADQEWMNLHGTRETRDRESEKKYLSPERIKEKDLEDQIEALQQEADSLREHWVHVLKADPVDVEESEIPPCCGNLSEVRDILMYTSKHGGITYYNIRRMINLLSSSHPEFLDCVDSDESSPALDKFCKQLKEPIAEAREEIRQAQEAEDGTGD